MAASVNRDASVEVSHLLNVPSSLIKAELEGMYGSAVLRDMYEIIQLYDIYEKGVQYPVEGTKDYTPADLRYKITRALIDKEARFLFSKSPDLFVDVDLGDTKEQRDKAKEAATIYQELVDKVLKENNFRPALVQAAKDCFIGKRVALMFNVNTEEGMQVSFLPSLEFVYDVDPQDYNKLTKIVAFYGINDEKSKQDQRIYKKKYWMDNGYCWINEAIYDGHGTLIEEITSDRPTKFPYIPAGVIVNDGLTGDLLGESEISNLEDFESWFSRISNADMDAERQGMNPVRWARDMNPESTKNLSIAAGAFWDLATDQNSAEGVVGEVGVLETSMNYTNALTSTLSRIKSSMYDTVDMPDVSPEALKGVVSSGKTLKAIYWGLIVRCDEKMLAWRPALENIVKIIIDGAKFYPGSTKPFTEGALPDVPFTVRVDNQYPLPEDEQEEKNIDLTEVQAQTMSKKSYMKKWRNLTDEEADLELQQIARERELLEDSFSGIPGLTSKEDNPDGET